MRDSYYTCLLQGMCVILVSPRMQVAHNGISMTKAYHSQPFSVIAGDRNNVARHKCVWQSDPCHVSAV